ncbi:hypothetical protein MACJ_001357 [Theileria orientalis]|uniref:Uncharacterized protein n=1 Tax=Theileria orientalis TaxID=68886 RepID=A0A976M8A0_THEOR|nr:hypothetical protein MACJ_001357 [Theileria orientalis]
MDDPLHCKITSVSSNKSNDKKILKPPSNPLVPNLITNKSYSINTNRKKRSRHETTTKVICSNCQTPSFYQIGDYVRCVNCNCITFDT